MPRVRSYRKKDGTYVREHQRRSRSRSTRAPARTSVSSSGLTIAVGAVSVALLLGGGTGLAGALGAFDSPANGGRPDSKQANHESRTKTSRHQTPAKDGSIQFTVKSVRLADNAQERKLIVTILAENLTKSWIAFYGEDQMVVSAAKEIRRGISAVFTLGPERTATLQLEFSMPASFIPAELELHYEPDSKGVRITVTVKTSE